MTQWGAVARKRKRTHFVPVPWAAWTKELVCGRSLAESVGSNPTGGMDVCCECCVLSGIGLCDELIIRREESYRTAVRL